MLEINLNLITLVQGFLEYAGISAYKSGPSFLHSISFIEEKIRNDLAIELIIPHTALVDTAIAMYFHVWSPPFKSSA